MSILPKEFVDLMDEKRKLEAKIAEAIKDFESVYGSAIEIDGLELLKYEPIGLPSTIRVTASLRIR